MLIHSLVGLKCRRESLFFFAQARAPMTMCEIIDLRLDVETLPVQMIRSWESEMYAKLENAERKTQLRISASCSY